MTVNTNVNLKSPELNADGLATWYGLNEDNVDRGGYVSTMGTSHVTEFNVDWTDLKLGTGATANYVLSYNTYIPKGAIIIKCEFLVTTAWDSASSDVAINFGLIKQSDYTIIDADGLMDSVAKTVIDLAGNVVVTQAVGSYPDITTYAGAELGVARGENDLVTCFWETHVPTVGTGILKVFWIAHATA